MLVDKQKEYTTANDKFSVENKKLTDLNKILSDMLKLQAMQTSNSQHMLTDFMQTSTLLSKQLAEEMQGQSYDAESYQSQRDSLLKDAESYQGLYDAGVHGYDFLVEKYNKRLHE
jgi:hypothetical protein